MLYIVDIQNEQSIGVRGTIIIENYEEIKYNSMDKILYKNA